MCRSVPQIPHAPTLTTISPRPGVGSSTVPTLMSPGFSMIAAFMPSPPYLTAPVVRPRTSCFWVSQPTITGTRIARVVNAESSAQNCPREVCCAATSTERGCHAMEVNETLNRNSFQAKITQSIAVEAMPARVSGMTICRSICESFTPSTWAASTISLGRSFINWYIIHTTIGVFIPTKTMMSTQTVSSSCSVLNITNKGTSTATCGSALVVMNQNTMLSLLLA